MFLVPYALDFAVDLFGSRHPAAGRVHVDHDGLDRVIISKLAQLLNHFTGIENDAFEIDHANLVAETEARLLASGVKRQVNHREHRENEEEEGSSPDENPEPN